MNSRILISNTALYVLWLLISISGSLHADENDDIQRGLVYFSPPVFIADKSQPCQGFHLSSNVILTSPACYTKILSLIDHSDLIEVLNITGKSIGKIKKYRGKKPPYHLFLESETEKNVHKDYSFTSEHINYNTELTVNYLGFNDGNPFVLKQAFNTNLNDKNSSNTYLQAYDYLPDGAVVNFKEKLFCVISGERCLRSRAFTRSFQEFGDDDCVEVVKSLSFFNCRKRLADTCEDQIYGLSASGNCTNPKTQEVCTFDSTYTTDVVHNSGWGSYDMVRCPSCSATHSVSDWGGNPNNSTDCSPKGCIGGCPGSDKTNSNLIAPIAGGIAGGVVLIGAVTTIATVVGCLIYKHKNRSSYQNL